MKLAIVCPYYLMWLDLQHFAENLVIQDNSLISYQRSGFKNALLLGYQDKAVIT